jgi:DNA-directed RNA polymerase specialized sigma24 family protein
MNVLPLPHESYETDSIVNAIAEMFQQHHEMNTSTLANEETKRLDQEVHELEDVLRDRLDEETAEIFNHLLNTLCSLETELVTLYYAEGFKAGKRFTKAFLKD